MGNIKKSEERKLNLDLDTICVLQDIGDEESLFYFRMYKDKMSVTFKGTEEDLIYGFITCMIEQEEMYHILSSALESYEEYEVHRLK